MAKTYSVSEITSYISRVLKADPMLSSVSVGGELSNVKYHASGHIYFTLKDKDAQLKGVMFKSDAGSLSVKLKEGMKVEVTGRIAVYEAGGAYQIYAKEIKEAGKGELYEKFLKLKAELEERGMFSDEYKKPVPVYIRRLGVVTAPTGAAVRDIINITRRRNPYVEIVLYPAQVQGNGAAESVARGIEVLNRAGVDVIIAGRGGGSIEDLWAFNEETVASAIFNSVTPVISAVGHETDTTIADYVADLRAPTPSAAAELAVFDYSRFADELEAYRSALFDRAMRSVSASRLKLKERESTLRKQRPDLVIADKRMRLADIETNMRQMMLKRLVSAGDRLTDARRGMSDAMQRKLMNDRHRLMILSEKLKGVSPHEKLTQGYSYVMDKDGRNVRDVDRLHVDDMIIIQMKNGSVEADVRSIKKNDD
ncbi:MAG: exodeoxyribonuclease VII large subunit [Lachnospiraceae bacterium]|nr:exodeoxyribonuclease VII large subunit [Lachnospiraceae bacterium]